MGRRSYRNTLSVFRDIFSRTNLERVPLIATDGFAFYAKVIRRVFGPACLYGQVIKTRSNDRIVRVERRAVIGAYWRLEKMLADSEDSSKLNTSFIERLNLTIPSVIQTALILFFLHQITKQQSLRRCFHVSDWQLPSPPAL